MSDVQLTQSISEESARKIQIAIDTHLQDYPELLIEAIEIVETEDDEGDPLHQFVLHLKVL